MKKLDAEAIVSLKNILFATDFSSHSAAALPYALSIARKYESRFFVVHVVSLAAHPQGAPSPAGELSIAQAVREAYDAMDALDPQWREVPHENIVRKGDIWTELSTVIEDKEIDLVITGTRGRIGMSKLLMGSVAEKIFRHASCPVLTVGPNISGEPESISDIHSILYATDFSKQARVAVPYAISLAQEHRANLYLLNVLTTPVDETAEAAVKSKLRNVVPPGAEFCCQPRAFIETGEPAQKILETAEEVDADLIVLGARRTPTLPGTTRLALATAYRVVREATCPVLTIRG